MEEKCKKCRYKNRNKNVFPCDKCLKEKLKEKPITCHDCRYAEIGGTCKKGIRPCNKFEWS